MAMKTKNGKYVVKLKTGSLDLYMETEDSWTDGQRLATVYRRRFIAESVASAVVGGRVVRLKKRVVKAPKEGPRPQLLRLMSAISERVYGNEWAFGLERDLWRAVYDGRAIDGVTREDVFLLDDLSLKANGWFVWDKGTEEPVFVTREVARRHAAAYRVRSDECRWRADGCTLTPAFVLTTKDSYFWDDAHTFPVCASCAKIHDGRHGYPKALSRVSIAKPCERCGGDKRAPACKGGSS